MLSEQNIRLVEGGVKESHARSYTFVGFGSPTVPPPPPTVSVYLQREERAGDRYGWWTEADGGKGGWRQFRRRCHELGFSFIPPTIIIKLCITASGSNCHQLLAA